MDPLVMVIGLVLAVYIAWAIGSNDAANPTNTAVGSGALGLKAALIVFSLSAFAGAVLQGWMVMKTFGGGVVRIRDLYDAVIATVATALWVTISSLYGMPISTTHSAVGSVLGIGLASYLIRGAVDMNVAVVANVVASWITSPLGSMGLAAGMYLLTRRFVKYLITRGVRREDVERLLRYLIVASLAYSAYSFGANDVGNATGVYYVVVGNVASEAVARLALAIIGAVGIAVGGFTLGRRVIETVAYRLTKLDLVTGFSAGISNALIVWLFTTVPTYILGYGMPVSTTHASVSAVLGVGLVKHGLRGVKWSTFLRIVLSWVLTVPLTAALSLSIRVLVSYTLGV